MLLKILLILRGCSIFAQAPLPVKEFKPDSLDIYLADSVVKKTIPQAFYKQIRVALAYYPTLKNTKIIFKVKKAKSPLAAAPTFWSVFKKRSNRTYIITISTESGISFLNKILLDSLSFNAQIGVLGHEISHILEFDSKRGIFFVGLVLRHVSKKAIDAFENNTDKRCIEQGLGYQLLAWSTEVRQNLKIKEWRGADNLGDQKRERYMSPPTILSLLNY